MEPAPALAVRKTDIVPPMTTSTARVLLDGSGGDGTITGVDPEGCDLRRERQIARLDFATPAAGLRRAGAAG